MPLPGYREQFIAQPLSGTASGLDRMAVRTQRDHLLWVVRAALREILDVIHFQDGVTGIGDVLRLTRAARALAAPFAAQQHGPARRLQAQNVDAHPAADRAWCRGRWYRPRSRTGGGTPLLAGS